MQLKKFSLGRKAIKFTIVLNPRPDDDNVAQEERTVTAHEAPLEELGEAFCRLPAVFCEIMALPKKYAEGMSVTELVVSTTKHGTRAVQLKAKKPLDTIGGQLHTIEAPFAKIDKPEDGESGDIQVSVTSAELIDDAIDKAIAYANGERSQQLLDFEDTKAALNAQFGASDDDQPSLV